ncbi:MAG: DUF350 domain-containing protein [Acidobacteriota bacterium]
MSYVQLDIFVTGVVYLAAIFVLLLLGKLIYARRHTGFVLAEELFENDNLALSLAVVGYYLGLVFALSSVLSGEAVDLTTDLIDLFLYGGLAIVLINLSSALNDKIILPQFRNEKEIIEDRNAGTGAVEAGNHIANGLIISGAVNGENIDLVVVLAFWSLGQLALILGGIVYNKLSGFNLHDEIEQDNVAVGVAFAGVLIGLGNLVRFSVSGDFIDWQTSLTEFVFFLLMGLVLLPGVRILTDRLLVTGASLTDEMVHQEDPNVGAGILEGTSYVIASILIGWAMF